MKVIILLSLLTFALGSIEDDTPSGVLVGYMSKYAIPLAEKIRKAEAALDASRIVGGSPSGLGQFPYQAGLLVSFAAGTGVCGASLVSPNRLVTAAHCWFDGVNQGSSITTVLGSITLFSGGNRQTTSNIVMHSQWNPNIAANDAAIIYLPNAVSFSNTISPINLPSGSEMNENFAGETATASGFGLTSNSGQITTSQVLSHVELNVITNTQCWSFFPLLIQSSNICTSGFGGTSTCNGDSGGPLAINRNGRVILIGLTSFGSALGCSSGFPAVYARATSYVNFFNQHI